MTKRSRTLGAFAITVLAAAGCARAPQLARGPLDLGPTPVKVTLAPPIPAAAGARWDLCLEFAEPGASDDAGRVEVTFVDREGNRRKLVVERLDRRGERLVALIGRAGPGTAADSEHALDAAPATADTVMALELRSPSPLRLRGLRGRPLP